MRKMRISLRESNFGLLPISFSITLVFIRVHPWFQKGFHDDANQADDAQ